MKHADIVWDDTGTPSSTQFNDVYFSKVGGLDETRHVFLSHNQLEQRFHSLRDATTAQTFVIAETGFGTGLNFLATCQLWQSILAETQHRLVFISTEMFPLSPNDLEKALTVWPELKCWSQRLKQCYPKVCSGLQTLPICPNISLLLAFGDAADSFSQLNAHVNAWFLDGFAPSKNPEMWSNQLFEQIQRLSGKETTFATFTAARVVKDLLNSHGFSFKKSKGFGRKRDMIHGEFIDHAISATQTNTDHTPKANTNLWYQTRKQYFSDRKAIIIGAGLAGAHTAYSLAERGWKVTVVDQAKTEAAGASGNYQGVLYTKPSIQETKEDRFYLAAFQYAVQHYSALFNDSDIWQQSGLLQLAHNPKEESKLAKVESKFTGTGFNELLTPEQANALSGVDLATEYSSLFYPSSGWINPAEACKALLNHKNITLVLEQTATKLRKIDKNWHVETQRAENSPLEDQKATYLTAPVVVLATAWETIDFEQTHHFPLTAIRGQVSNIKTSELPNTINNLNTVVCSDSYVTPWNDNQLNFGATFDLKVSDQEYKPEDTHKNIQKLSEISDQYTPLCCLPDDSFSGRASVRCITNDRMPVIGLVNNHSVMLEHYQPLKKDRNWTFKVNEQIVHQQYHNGLYTNLGHGSKGLTTIPLCTELLCAHIENAPLPLSQDLVDALNSARFTIKGLIQNKY